MIGKIAEFVQSGLGQFVIAVLVILGAWLVFSLRNTNWKQYFSTEDGRGVAKSALIGVGAILLIVLASVLLGGCSPTVNPYGGGTFNNGASVFAGLDWTKKTSPQCESIGPDDHTTSNLGLRYHLYESADGVFRANLKYTHHSCAFSPDDDQYDGGGIELVYDLW